MQMLNIDRMLSSLKRLRTSEYKGVVSVPDFVGFEERPKIEYTGLVDIYEKDPTAGFVIDGTVKAGLGIGYHYRSDGSPEGEEQVRILEEFNNNPKVMMRGKNIEIGVAMYGYGFCPVEPNTPDFMTEITTLPLRAHWSWKRHSVGGRFIYIRERFNGGDVKFDVENGELIPFVMNANADNPLGRGILHRLAETAPYKIVFSDGDTRRMTRFSLYKAKQMLIHDISKLIHNGVPKSVWKIRVKDSEVANTASKVEKMEPGQRILTNASDVDVKSELTDIRNGYKQIINAFNDDYNMALQSFLPKFFGEAAWTEASSITAERIWYNALVQNLQDTFAEIKTHKIDDVILKQNGFTENNTKFYWGMPKGPDIQPAIVVQVMAQIVSFSQAGIIAPQYALDLFNQLLDVLGNMGITLDAKASTPEQLGTVTTKMAQALLDGDVSTDKRSMAEQWLKKVKHISKSEPVIPRRI